MPHGRQIKDGERKKEDMEASLLTAAATKLGDAAFTPATTQDLQHSRANTDPNNSHNTQHTKVNKIHCALRKRALSPARRVLEKKNIKSDPSFDAGLN
jgi:hypothetical protein